MVLNRKAFCPTENMTTMWNKSVWRPLKLTSSRINPQYEFWQDDERLIVKILSYVTLSRQVIFLRNLSTHWFGFKLGVNYQTEFWETWTSLWQDFCWKCSVANSSITAGSTGNFFTVLTLKVPKYDITEINKLTFKQTHVVANSEPVLDEIILI